MHTAETVGTPAPDMVKSTLDQAACSIETVLLHHQGSELVAVSFWLRG